MAPHEPGAGEIAQRAGNDAGENIRHIVIASPNGGDAHAGREGKQNPEKPASMAPRAPERSDRASYMLGGKRGATHASVVLDKVDRGGEGASLKLAGPP